MKTVLAVLAIISQLGQNTHCTYSLEYYDCHSPRQIRAYQRKELCNQQTHNQTKATPYALLQTKLTEKLRAFSCSITRSTLTLYCGAYSHSKMAQAPEIELPQSITKEHCHQLADSRSFETPDGQRHKISIDAENIIQSLDLGTVSATSSGVACQGQTFRMGNHLVNDIVRISQYKVKVLRVEMQLQLDEQRIEILDDRTRLPQGCNPQQGGCQLAERTLIWERPKENCQLERIRTTHLTQDNDYLIDRQNKILLKKKELIPTPKKCGKAIIWPTEYDNLFLSNQLEGWSEIQDDADITDFIRTRDDYILWRAERLVDTEKAQLTQKICQQGTQEQPNADITHIHDNRFYKTNGDAIDMIECTPKIGKIKENMETCYRDIPIEEGFIQPQNRLFMRKCPMQPCSSHFGVKVHTREGVWIELNPIPRTIPTPAKLPSLSDPMTPSQHEDLSDGGIYSTSELESWRKHLEVGNFHDAVSRTLTYGVCITEGECQADHETAPRFSL